MKYIHIREATVNDVEEIAHVHVQCWRETYSGIVPADYLSNLSWQTRAEKWDKMLREEKSLWKMFVVDEEGAIRGFVNAGPSRESDFGLGGELYALYTLKQIHGRGIGRKLFEKARNSLALSGIMDMYLWVLKDNPTIDFYRHMGGREIARQPLSFGAAVVEEVAMAWEKV